MPYNVTETKITPPESTETLANIEGYGALPNRSIVKITGGSLTANANMKPAIKAVMSGTISNDGEYFVTDILDDNTFLVEENLNTEVGAGTVALHITEYDLVILDEAVVSWESIRLAHPELVRVTYIGAFSAGTPQYAMYEHSFNQININYAAASTVWDSQDEIVVKKFGGGDSAIILPGPTAAGQQSVLNIGEEDPVYTDETINGSNWINTFPITSAVGELQINSYGSSFFNAAGNTAAFGWGGDVINTYINGLSLLSAFNAGGLNRAKNILQISGKSQQTPPLVGGPITDMKNLTVSGTTAQASIVSMSPVVLELEELNLVYKAFPFYTLVSFAGGSVDIAFVNPVNFYSDISLIFSNFAGNNIGRIKYTFDPEVVFRTATSNAPVVGATVIIDQINQTDLSSVQIYSGTTNVEGRIPQQKLDTSTIDFSTGGTVTNFRYRVTIEKEGFHPFIGLFNMVSLFTEQINIQQQTLGIEGRVER